MTNIINQIIEGHDIDAATAEALAQQATTEDLLAGANALRIHFLGRHFDTCSIMNARSGHCSEDCAWCSQSAHHKCNIEIYPFVSQAQALPHALKNHSQGVERFSLVTSGRRMASEELHQAAELYGAIAARCDIRLCASMGLMSRQGLQELFDAGVRRYHCNIESAPSFFPTLCTTHTIEQKLQTIEWAKEVGMEICSGGIIGMGETMNQRIEMALLLRKIGVDSIPLNILNPIPGTPLASQAPLSQEEMLRTFAIFRLINARVHIRFAGGRAAISGMIDRALEGGISGAIVGDMLTTLGASVEQDVELIARHSLDSPLKK
ncbi:MAG: biotin synthase BioB [Mucinivorans sp.]